MTFAKSNASDAENGDFNKFEDTVGLVGEEYTLEGFLASHIEKFPAEHNVRGEILYFNKNQELLEQIAYVGFEETTSVMRVRPIKKAGFDGQGLCIYAAVKRESVLVADVREDTRYTTVQGQSDLTRAEMVIPLQVGQKLVGILNLESDFVGIFEEKHLAYFEQILPIAALMIEYETFKREEVFLTRALAEITRETDMEVILAKTLESVLSLMGKNNYGCVLMPVGSQQSPGTMKVVASRGLLVEKGQHISIEQLGVIRRAWQSKEGFCYWSEEQGTEEYTQIAAEKDIRSEYARVLEVAGRVVAVLDIESSSVAISERFKRAIERLTEYAAALLYGLQEKGRAERQEGVNAALVAVEHEMHNAAGMFGILLSEVRRRTDALSPRMITLSRGIRTRFGMARTIMKSFLESATRVKLDDILAASEQFAQQVGVDLTMQELMPQVEVLGSETGYKWLFENLLLNSKQHGPDTPDKKAWISMRQDDQHIVLEYWDNGQAPDGLETFLERNFKRRGVKHIKMLCHRYNWHIAVAKHENGSLLYRFNFLRC